MSDNDYGFPSQTPVVSDIESENSFTAERNQATQDNEAVAQEKNYDDMTEEEKVKLMIKQKQAEIAAKNQKPSRKRKLYRKPTRPNTTCRDVANNGFRPFSEITDSGNTGNETQGFGHAPAIFKNYSSHKRNKIPRRPENAKTGSRSERASRKLEKKIKKFKQNGREFTAKNCESWEERSMFHRRSARLYKHKLTKKNKENLELKIRLSRYEHVDMDEDENDDKSTIFDSDTGVQLEMGERTQADNVLIDNFFNGRNDSEEDKQKNESFSSDSDENFKVVRDMR